MSKKPDQKSGFADPLNDINTGLSDLLGALGDTLNQVMTSVETLSDQDVAREQVIQTPDGPIQARAGVQIRIGGLAGKLQASGDRDPAEPLNRRDVKPKNTTGDTEPVSKREPLIDVYESEGNWMLTAELPGVSLEDISLGIESQTLHIATTGRQKFSTEVSVPADLDLDQLQINLTNGILELRRGTAGATEDE
ncbi:MAG: Hsp20/alpha crystallin family protein [Pseudomonadota bacterium]